MATRLGDAYVTVQPDFSGFQEKVAAKLNESLGPAFDKAGKNASKRLGKSIANDSSLRSSLQPLLKRFQKTGDNLGEELAAHIGKGSKRAEGDMFGLSGAIKEMEKRSSSASSRAKILSNDTFGIAKAASDAGQGYKLLRNSTRDWGNEAKKVDSIGKRLSKGITSLFHDVRDVGGNLKAAAGGFGNFEGTMARANRAFQFFKNILGSLKVPAFAASVALLAQSLSALAAGAVAVVSALGPLSGALVAIPAAALAGAQAVGVLKLALSGIGDAVKAATAVQVQGGEQAVDTLRKQENAAEAVADAHRTLSSAERDQKYAQEDLTKARKEAERQLESLRRASEESNLTEREGVQALREARRELNKTLREPSSTGLDIRSAEQAVERAQFGLSATREEAKHARQDYAEANKKGVEGMPEVVSVKRAVADADRSVADAERGVAKAVRENSDALKEQGSAATALQQKMAELTPSGRKFAKFLISLKPRYDELREAAGKGFFPGAESGLKSAMKNFGVIKGIVGETSSALGDLAAKAGQKLGSEAWGRDLGKVGETNTRVIERLGQAGLNLGDAFRNILVSARPLIEWMSKGVVKFSEWAKSTAQAERASGGLSHFFEETREAMEKVWRILKPLGEGLLAVGKAAKPLGDEILGSLGKSAEGWAKWTKSTEGQNQLKNYFKEVKPAIYALGRLVRDLTDDFFELGRQKGVATLVETIRKTLLPLLTNGAGALTGFFSGFLNKFNDLRKEGVPAFDAFIQTLIEHAGEAGAKLAGALWRGFLNAGFLGKLAVGGWLFSKLGGVSTVLKVGELLGQKLGTGAGEEGASTLASSLGKALGPALGAIGIANIITSATKGDWKDAGFEAGGALAGGVVGFFASGGNPLGAAAGVGIGSVLGEALSGLFHSEKKLTPLQKQLSETTQNLAHSLHHQAESAELTSGAQEGLREAQKRVHHTTAELRQAEKNLTDARNDHGSGSLQVLQREAEVRQKRQGTKKATNELRFAEEELAFAKKAQGRSVAQTIHDSSLAVAADKKWIERIKERISVEGWSKTATEQAQRASKKLAEDESTRSQALKVARQRNVAWAESLEQMTTAQHKFGQFGRTLQTRIENLKAKIVELRQSGAENGGPLNPLNKSLEDAKSELRTAQSRLLNLLSTSGPKLKTWALQGGGHVEALGGSFESLSGTVSESLGTIQENVSGMLKSFDIGHVPKFTVKYLHSHSHGNSGKKYLGMLPSLPEEQRGGLLRPAKLATGGLAATVPGNSTGDRHTLALNGRPIAKVESREGIFVGNRKMMAAAKQANDAVPRFQNGGFVGSPQQLKTGGLVEPKLEGQAGSLKQLGQSAIKKVYEGAKNYLDKHKAPATGGSANYVNAGGGPVMAQIYRVLKANGFNKVGAAGVIGNAIAESSLDPSAMEPGTHNGGLWGFTTGEKSLASLEAYASKIGRPWTDVATQTTFMLNTGGLSIRSRLNAASSGAEAARLFEELYEAAGIVRMEVREQGAREAMEAGFQEGGLLGFLPKLASGGYAWRGIGTEGLHSGIRNLAGYVMSKYSGLEVTSTIHGQHAANSYHYKGEAVDLASGDYGYMDQAAGWIKSSGLYKALVEGIHNPNLSVESGALVDPSYWGSETWAAHANHIHLAVDHPWTASGFESGSASSASSGQGAKEEPEKKKPPKEKPLRSYDGVQTKAVHFGQPKTLKATEREIERLEKLRPRYAKAAAKADKDGKAATGKVLHERVHQIDVRLKGLRSQRNRLRLTEAKKALKRSIAGKLAKIAGYGQRIEGSKHLYEEAAQFAEQVVGLEPESPEIAPEPELPETATDKERRDAHNAYEKSREAQEKTYVANYTAYIEGQEAPAYQQVLARVADWRNTILRAETHGFGKGQPSVDDMERGWEKSARNKIGQIGHINDFTQKVGERVQDYWAKVKKEVADWRSAHPHAKHLPKRLSEEQDGLPEWLKKQVELRGTLRAKLPFLREEKGQLEEAIGEAREAFFSGGENRLIDPPTLASTPLPGSGTFEEDLAEVQGLHQFPDQHGLLGAGDLAGPNVAGQFGGVIWSVREAIQGLGLKIRQAGSSVQKASLEGEGSGSEESAGESERTQLLEELLEKANQRLAVKGGLEPVISQFNQTYPLPFAGTFHTGGTIAGSSSQEYMARVRGAEHVLTPEQMAALSPAGEGVDGLTVHVNGDIHQDPNDPRDPVEAFIGDRRVEAHIEQVASRTRRPLAGNAAGRAFRP